MIDDSLVKRVELALTTEGVYLSKGDVSELHKNYVSLIEQNADLHKLNTELRGRIKSGYEAYARIEAIKQRYNAESKQKQKMLDLAWGAICEAGYEDHCNELRDFMS